MSVTRFNALQTLENRQPAFFVEDFSEDNEHIAGYFGVRVFGDEAMKKHLSEEAYLSVKAAVQSGQKLSRDLADQIADGMKEWAMQQGCTHFAHWFQPLTGKTAEKHDSFFTVTHDGRVIEEFTGAALAQQEPDGSSFPSGGLRSTFEARGYTVWDPSSPAFIMAVGEGKTLCIPTTFVTYDGKAQDYKLPLLRSQQFLDKAATAVARLFDERVNKVTATLGWEQEYFVIDEALFNARPDLLMTGRTLTGAAAAKNQQLEDHYFGVIPERIYNFMRELETECHQLGIPVRTRHNEVAPAQYEVAPMFEEVNVAVDHNQLLMDLMDRVAQRHNLRVLLHEKPFAGVNGSGKHNNWSMSTNLGVNLLSPGGNPRRNLRFLTFFVNTIMAVHKYADILRASIAHAGNDHRLGANEAPPAIISVFIGDAMSRLLDEVARGEGTGEEEVRKAIDLVAKLPNLELDNTDRNRTSPFAFTGNKFEIRAVGSSQNCAGPMTIMNTMMGLQLLDFKNDLDARMAKGEPQEEAILSALKEYIRQSHNIIFEGNNYSEEWRQEAARRGLNNFDNTPDALAVLNSDMAKEFFSRSGVMNPEELEAYYNVQLHIYCTKLNIEARMLDEMTHSMLMPAVIRYQTELADNIIAMNQAGMGDACDYQKNKLRKIAERVQRVRHNVDLLNQSLRRAHEAGDVTKEANILCKETKLAMEQIRLAIDELEGMVEDQYWPLVKYREMLFMR